VPVAEQVAIIWARTNGYLDDVPIDQVRAFEAQYLDYLRTAKPEILQRIATEKALSDDLIEVMKKATEEFKSISQFGARPAAAAAD